MAENVSYSLNLTIPDMVFTRLPFLEKTEANNNLIKSLVVEVMFELEICFKTGLFESTELEWDESHYNVLQKSIIADIVCCYILIIKMLANIGGVASTETTTGSVAGKFLKSAKAGSVAVEWEQFDLNKATLAMTGESLLNRYRKGAISKAAKLGCVIDICDDCSMTVMQAIADNIAPFKIVNFPSSNCGCCGDVPERG